MVYSMACLAPCCSRGSQCVADGRGRWCGAVSRPDLAQARNSEPLFDGDVGLAKALCLCCVLLMRAAGPPAQGASAQRRAEKEGAGGREEGRRGQELPRGFKHAPGLPPPPSSNPAPSLPPGANAGRGARRSPLPRASVVCAPRTPLRY